MTKIQLPQNMTVRPCQMDDLEATVDFLNLCAEHDNGERGFSIGGVKSEWVSDSFDLNRNSRLVLNEDNEIVGYGEVYNRDSPPVRIITMLRVHPDYRQTTIGDFLLTWAESFAHEAVPLCPAEARVFLSTMTYNNDAYLVNLFETHGMVVTRCFHRMQIDFDEPVSPPIFPDDIPDDIMVRPYRHDEDLVALYRADDEVSQDHWGYLAQSEADGVADFRNWVEDDEDTDISLWFLAMDGDEIAGYLLAIPTRGEIQDIGQIAELGVRPAWRKQGIGEALLRHALAVFQGRNYRSVMLDVDAGNFTGANRLYEKAGMSVRVERNIYEKDIRTGVELRKVMVDA